MLQKIEKEYPSGYICVTFDRKAPTFRHLEYEEYKAGRKKMPPELAMQMPILKDVLHAMNIETLEMDGFEADDLIGTLAKRGEEQGMVPLIITGDRDELQLATDTTKVMITKKGISQFDLFDHDAMVEKYGFTPTQFIDFKGLMGDPSDNIPGLPGVGEKTAQKLILEYGSVENLLEHTDELKGKLKTTVEDNQALALMSKRLATINTNVPFDFDKETYNWTEPDYEALLDIYKRLEFNSFIRDLDMEGVDLSAAGGEDIPEAVRMEDVLKKIRVVELAGDPSPVREALEKAREKDENAALVIKTFGDLDAVGRPNEAVDTLTSIGMLAGDSFFFLKVQNDACRTAVRDFFQTVRPKVGGVDIKQDYVRLMTLGLTNFETTFDCAICQYVLDPGRSNYSIAGLSKEFLSYEVQDDRQFAEAETQMDMFGDDSAKELAHALKWCAAAREIDRVQRRDIKDQDLNTVYETVELPLIQVMASMEYIGFDCDEAVLKNIGDGISGAIDTLTKSIHELAGEEFNINSTQQLGPILFEKLGLPAGKKTKKGYSTSADILEKLQDKHPIVPQILEYRSLTKLMGTYIEGLIPLIREDGRIHAHFNQTIAATGRISSSDPNLQNIPVRSELGRSIRKAFIPENGDCLLVGADYSQIELRVLAHMSQDEALIGAFNRGEDIHRATAARVLGLKEEEITPLQRSRAKAINFGVIYGMSSFGLSGQLDISRKDAEQYINDYFAGHPKVKEFMDEQVATAKATGCVKTILGRKRYIKEISAGNYMVRQMGERLAMNSPIQGSAADIIKLAMVHIYKALMPYKSKLILQVHDELIINTYKDEEEVVKKLLVETMEKAMELSVELLVDLNEGENWYLLK